MERKSYILYFTLAALILCTSRVVLTPMLGRAVSPATTTITSSPVTGSSYVKVDGTLEKTPYSTLWIPGTSHTVYAISPVLAGEPLTQYVFTNWTAPSFGTTTCQTYTYTVPSYSETVTAYYTVTTSQWVQTCNNSGAPVSSFSTSEDVYVTGNGFQACATLDIYIVCHQAKWTNGETIPSRIAGTATTVTTEASGNIPPTVVWTHNLAPGSYDIVIATNGNGKYDQGVDYLIANGVNVNAGFFVIPEYVLGAILGLAAFLVAYRVFRLRTRTPHVVVKKTTATST